MKQSRSISLLKSIISTVVGFGLSLFLQWTVLSWLLGISVPIAVNLKFAAIMTAVSIARGYGLERFFEAMGWRRKFSPAMHAVIEERFRQIEGEGWDAAHDDAHMIGELGCAGAAYILHAGTESKTIPPQWPWDGEWWKPRDRRRNLVRGIALAIAELERFDRNRKPFRPVERRNFGITTRRGR